ncbi:FAD-dependent monooxygenase [Sciscionella sediminilitoris]|uniref:FAD-dependent monooxygenase n=1 Tax=Sciscionella sediminilitoris TaxID=1445613 RepID=UPI00055C5CD9|nr:FAD-dependent monooxygenase [Sciscionella sp. SE31]
MTARTSELPRIAIVGGGIGGLAVAAFLHREGIPATVYEQAARLTDVGAGLVIAPNAGRLLRRLGAFERLRPQLVRLEIGWQFRRWADGTVLSSENLANACARLYGEHTYTAHRADVVTAIRSRVPADLIELGHTCTGLEPAGAGWRIRFADGGVTEADVVIGADGVHSVVRGALVGAGSATYSGLCAFRALVPDARAPAFARRPAQTLWIGPGHHLVHYPISAGNYVNLVGIAPAGDYRVESWTATGTVEGFLGEFDGWDHRVIELIRAAGTPGRWALLDRAPLDRWSAGSATLLGDAAHPMFPFFAQGAAQSIEDGAVLARCLASGLQDPAGAFRRYEELRIPRTTRIQAVSHGRSHVNHLPDGPEQRARDAAFAEQDPLVANGWIYAYDPEDVFTDSGIAPGR